MTRRIAFVLSLCLLWTFASAAHAQRPERGGRRHRPPAATEKRGDNPHEAGKDQKAGGANAEAKDANEKKPDKNEKPKQFVTEHHLTLADGTTIDYTATAGELFLKDDKGKPQASIFTIAYTKKGVEDASTRPIAFAFNGGPGSSATWLHLGLLGPKRVDVPSNGTDAGAPPYHLNDNPLSLLAVSDLVFVDPVGTGYSHAIGDKKDEDYWGVDEDGSSVAEFIRDYITDNHRWNSPKYLIGESYGTIRAAVLVRDLQAGLNSVALNGVVLIGSAMNTRFILGGSEDMSYVTYLPSYAAAAWYHNALPDKPADFNAFMDKVTDFAEHEYLTALFQGAALDDATKAQVLEKLHDYTGLSKTYLKNAHLRVGPSRFRRELLRDRGQVIGRFDSRYIGTEPGDDAGEYPSGDPSGSGVDGAFVATMNDYLERDLAVKMDRDYVVISGEAGGKWKPPGRRGRAFGGFLNVLPYLARGMVDNKDLRVFVASGYYDLATAYFASQHMVHHSGMDPARVTMKTYEAGHMAYVHQASFERLAKDLKEFVEAGKK